MKIIKCFLLIKESKYDYLNRLNRRTQKVLDDKTTTYVYHKNRVIQEYETINNSKNLTNTYVYGNSIDDVLAYSYNNQTYYYVKDRLGSITNITNQNGIVIESYSYNSFGIMSIKNQNGNVLLKSNVNNTYTYTGRRVDYETNLYYYRNRMYSAELGRFLSQDPLGYVDGLNLYAYVGNNPLNFVDPMGTSSKKKGKGSGDYDTDGNGNERGIYGSGSGIGGTSTDGSGGSGKVSSIWNSVKNMISEKVEQGINLGNKYGQDAVSVLGGGLQVATGSILVATGAGVVLGSALIAHGANNIYEGGANIIDKYNGNEKANNVGWTRGGYRAMGNGAYNIYKGQDITTQSELGNSLGDLAYYSGDLLLATGSLLKNVGVIRKLVHTPKGTYTKIESKYSYQTLSKGTLLVETAAFISNIKSIKKDANILQNKGNE